jgi:formylmethanofuran dehydrogenase subunit D
MNFQESYFKAIAVVCTSNADEVQLGEKSGALSE